MSPQLFVVALAVGAGALALWTDVRVPRLAPTELRGILLHALAAMVVLRVLAGAIGPLASGAFLTKVIVVLGLALPVLGYAFLTGIWAIRLFQGAYAGTR